MQPRNGLRAHAGAGGPFMLPDATDGRTDEQYVAFMSYRHGGEDARWARRLHRSLERYRAPRSFAAKHGLPRRLGRVFLDDAELSASGNLGEGLRTALARSRFLIVMCSPVAADSPWIDAEVNAFIGMRGRQNVLAVLLQGEPTTAFPPSLRPDAPSRATMLGDGVASEPAAADLRPLAGRSSAARMRLATVKLAAALFGCSFDDLWSRDLRRRRVNVALLSGTAVVSLAAAATAAAKVQRSQREAEAQREARAETEFIAERESGRRDVLAGKWTEAIAHIECALSVRPADTAARFLLARARAIAAPGVHSGKVLGAEVGRLGFPRGRVVAIGGDTAAVLDPKGTRLQTILGVKAWSAGLERLVTLPEPTDRAVFDVHDASAGVKTRLVAPMDGRMTCLAISPKGRYLAAAVVKSNDGSEAAWIWDLGTAATAVAVEADDGETEDFSFSGDEGLLLVLHAVSAPSTPSTWFTGHDAATGRRLFRVDASPEIGAGLSVALDRSRAVLVTPGGKCRLIELPSSREIAAWDVEKPCLGESSFSVDGSRVLTPEHDFPAMTLRDASDGRVIAHLPSGEFAGDGTLYATVDGATIVVDPTSGEPLRTAFSPSSASKYRSQDGRVTVCCELDARDASVWRMPEAQRRGSIPVPASPRVVARDDEGRVWVGCDDGSVIDFLLDDLSPHRDIKFGELGAGVVFMGFADGSNRVFSVATDGRARLWDSASGALIAETKFEVGKVASADAAADGSLLAVFGADRAVLVDVPHDDTAKWPTARISIEREQLRDPTDRAVRIMPGLGAGGGLDGTGNRFLVTTKFAPWAMVMTVSGASPNRIPLDAPAVVEAVAKNGRIAVLGLESGNVVRIACDGSSRTDTSVGHIKIRRIVVSDDASRAAVSCEDGTIVLLGADGAALATLAVPSPPGGCLAFDRSGTYLFAAGSDGRGAIISCRDGAVLGRVDQAEGGGRLHTVLPDFFPADDAAADRADHPNAIHSAVFNSTGKLLATGSNDSTVCIWDVASLELLTVRRVDGNGGVTCMAFSPDDTMLAVGDSFASASVWDVGLAPPSLQIPTSTHAQSK